MIESAVYHEPLARGLELRHDGFLAGLDLVRDLDGSLAVLEDNTRTPSGLGYAIGARAAVDGELADLAPAGRLDVQEGYGMVADALRAAAPDGVDDPLVVLLSDGPGNSAWHEHQQYAARMDVPLVTPGDLAVRGGRLHARLGGERSRPVDVVYRRTDEDRLSDEEGRPTWLAELLLPPAREGTLTVVNPLGSGLADDKLVHAYVEDMVRFYLDEEPLLRSVTHLRPRRPRRARRRHGADRRAGGQAPRRLRRDRRGAVPRMLGRRAGRGRDAGCAQIPARSWPRSWSRSPPTRP